MIEIVTLLTFIAGVFYGIAGMGMSHRLRPDIDDALAESGINPYVWGHYVGFMAVVLWPVLAFLIVLATGYETLTGVSE